MRGDGVVLRRGDVGDVDEDVRPQRLADLVERHARHGEVGEERRIALDQLAKDAREGEVIGMDLDRARRQNQVGTKPVEHVAQPRRELLGVCIEGAVGEAEKIDRRRQRVPRLLLAARAVGSGVVRRRRLHAVRGHGDAHRGPGAEVL